MKLSKAARVVEEGVAEPHVRVMRQRLFERIPNWTGKFIAVETAAGESSACDAQVSANHQLN
jgi:hypothetical protein